MIERQQCSVLLQAILTLHGLQQNWNELRPLPGAVQTGHLGYKYCDLGCYLLGESTGRKKKITSSTAITLQKVAMALPTLRGLYDI